MAVIGAVLVVLAAWLCGRALLPSRETLARSRWEEQALAYLLGACALVLAGMAVTWAGLKFDGMTAWLLLLAGGTAGVIRVRNDKRGGSKLEPAPMGRAAGVLLAVLGSAAALATIAFPINEFDPLIHFAFKGKILFYTGDPLDEAFTGVGGLFGRINTHPNYPLGIPFLEAYAAHAGLSWSERWVQLPLAFWTACLPMMAAVALRPLGPKAATLGALLAACTPILVVRDFLLKGWLDVQVAGLVGRMTIGGGADLPLATLFLAAIALLTRARAGAGLHVAALGGLAMAGAIFMKNEGLALAGVLAIAMVMATPRMSKASWAKLGVFAAVCAIAAAPWLLHRAKLPAVDENYTELIRLERFQAAMTVTESPPAPALGGDQEFEKTESTRPALIGQFFLAEFTNLLSWGLLWLLFFLCLPIGRSFRDAESRWLALIVLGAMLLYALILLISPWSLYQLRYTGIPDRLLLHLLGPAVLLITRRLALPAKAAGTSPPTIGA